EKPEPRREACRRAGARTLRRAAPGARIGFGTSTSGHTEWMAPSPPASAESSELTRARRPLVLASLLMLSGSMADRLGRRRVFETGLVLFALASLLCSVAPSLEWLIAFRMLQAVGGSMLNPVAMSIIRNVFTDARERAQAIGMWGATVGISLALGPVV